MDNENETLVPETETKVTGRDGKTPVKVKSEEGKTERKPRYMSSEKTFYLSQQVLPPVTRRGFATYMGINEDRVDPSSADGSKIEPQTFFIPGSYMFMDIFETDNASRRKLIRNPARPTIERDDKGKSFINDVNEDMVEFINGIKQVTIASEYMLYLFLELHPLNATNKWRDRSMTPMFHRSDLQAIKSDYARSAVMDLALEAEMAVRDMIKSDEIRAYALAMGVTTEGMTTESVKQSLRMAVRNEPQKFFKSTKKMDGAVKMTVLDADSWGIIEYNPDKKSFIFVEDDEVIFTHAHQESPMDSLIKYLAKPNGDSESWYNRIYNKVNYWEA